MRTTSNVRKPKFQGKKTKWEKRRFVKNYTRQSQGKKPLVEPLTIAPTAERNAAFKKGKMVFYDGTERLEIPIRTKKYSRLLVGIYKLLKPGKPTSYITLRLHPGSISNIVIDLVKKNKGKLQETVIPIGFANIDPDLGHMRVDPDYQGSHLALKAVSKVDRHMRSKKGGSHVFLLNSERPGFKELIEKIGYKSFMGGLGLVMQKDGKHEPKDNLGEFIRIEAIDPKTGKAKLFTFKIKQ